MAEPEGPPNLFRGRVVGRGPAGAAVEIAGGVVVHVCGDAPRPGSEVVLAVRPEALQLNPEAGLENMLRARVTGAIPMGEAVLYEVETPGGLVLHACHRGRRFAPGDPVRVAWAAAHTVLRPA